MDMAPEPGFLTIIVRALESSGTDLRGWALAWARISPSIAIVPAFGLRAMPAPARIALGLALAASVAPALAPLPNGGEPWPLALLVEAAKGLPIALTAAIALWAATMSGGLIDNLRGSRESSSVPALEAGATPTGVLFGLLAAVAFLQMGGPARIALLAANPALEFRNPLLGAVNHLTRGIELAVLVAAPIIAASVVLEIASALVARAASPAYVQQLIAPLRSLALLVITAVLLERMLAVLVASARHVP
jgi:type III secretory pathway component EscT